MIAIVTAAVTSSFVARAQAARQQAETADDQQEQTRTDARLDDLAAQLEGIQTTLNSLTKA